MPNKMLPISVRISLDDATFLSGFSISGATTPSEKIRALIKGARHRQEGVRDYAEGLRVQEEQMAPIMLGVLEAENRLGMHSEFVNLLARWLPEAQAHFLAHGPGPVLQDDDDELGQTLATLEKGAADRVISLLENVLRLAITPKSPCYDDALFGQRIESALELCGLISSLRVEKGETTS